MHTQEWIPDSVWLNVLALEEMDAFRGLADAVVRGDAAWRAWYDQEAPERAPVPEYDQRLTKFQRMCIVKVPPAALRLTLTYNLLFFQNQISCSTIRFTFKPWKFCPGSFY